MGRRSTMGEFVVRAREARFAVLLAAAAVVHGAMGLVVMLASQEAAIPGIAFTLLAASATFAVMASAVAVVVAARWPNVEGSGERVL